jgi:hypothetical protein
LVTSVRALVFKFADEKGVMLEGNKVVRVTDINLDKALDLYQKAAVSGDALA